MTIEQLAIKVLSKMGVGNRGTPEPEDLENVSDAYLAVYYTLLDDALVTWAETDEIPIRLSLPVISLVMAELADVYQFPEPPIGWLQYKRNATNQIRRQLASGQPTETVSAEYF